MADISLDDFIKKKNFKVRLNNPKVGQPQGRKQPQPQGRKLQQAQARKPQQNGQSKFKNLGQRPPVGKTFDARSKLSAKPVADARDKIVINKKSGVGDARNKIVNLQVKKGTFDARSLLQKNQKAGPKKPPGPIKAQTGPTNFTRTLSNPNAKNHAQIRTTPNGLQVTRRVPDTQVAFTGSSLQVTRRNKPAQNIGDAVPIIQIRNDKYRNPAVAAAPPPTQHRAPLTQHRAPPTIQPSQYQAQLQSHRSYAYTDYEDPQAMTLDPYSDPYSDPSPYPPAAAGDYTDWDNPDYNPQPLEIPRGIHSSHLKAVEDAGMRPVSVSRAPPGSATVSQLPRQPIARQPILQQPIARQQIQRQPKEVAQGPSLRMSASSLKRKPAAAPELSGPLRLGRGGGPGIDLDPSPNKKSKPAAPAAEHLEVIDLEEDTDVISPLQGYRVMVTNLFNGVTQDDVIELFGAVGPLKKAKLLKAGAAEVVYMTKDNAVSAVSKYHGRELDGQPMYVKMTTPVAAVVKHTPNTDPDITGEALRLYKKPSSMGPLPIQPVEVPTILRALFKAGPPGPNKSVKFTVKI